MTVLQNVWWLLVLIGAMILIHELGHYWAARLFNVRVDTFSFGFGPRLFGFRRGDTDFRFSPILFGGYVKMAGDQPGDESAALNDPGAFLAKPRWQRLIIAAAGPLMNIILAVAILTGLFMVRFPKLPNNPDPVIGYVAPNSPAAKAGVQAGDRIVQIDNAVDPTWEDVEMRTIASAQHNVDVWTERNGQRQHFNITPKLDPKTGAGIVGWSEQMQIEVASVVPAMGAEKAGLQKGDVLEKVNGQPIRSVENLHDVIASENGAPVNITYLRDGTTGHATVQPRRSELDGPERWMIGVQLTPRITIEQLSFPAALGESVRQNAKGASMIYTMLKGIAEHKMSSKSLTGPIGIAQLSGEAAREGAGVFFGLMATVSLNLAILNLLPIPILDGGVIVLLLIEMFMRRDLSMRVREAVLKAGFVFLMAVVVFVLYNDITKLAG